MEIIIAEDDGVMRAKLVALVEDFGYTTRAFEDGAAAWKSFNEKPVSLVIADWNMPGISGLDLCWNVRNRPETGYVYFVLITAAEPGEMGYDSEIGSDVDDFLVKPITRAALWRRLRVGARILRFSTAIRQMESLLPICSYCHKIRDEAKAAWEPLEEYVSTRTGSDFTHGVCPDCEARVRAEIERFEL